MNNAKERGRKWTRSVLHISTSICSFIITTIEQSLQSMYKNECVKERKRVHSWLISLPMFCPYILHYNDRIIVFNCIPSQKKKKWKEKVGIRKNSTICLSAFCQEYSIYFHCIFAITKMCLASTRIVKIEPHSSFALLFIKYSVYGHDVVSIVAANLEHRYEFF